MPKQESKDKIYNKLFDYLNRYKQILICEIKDLPADMVHKVRKLLRGINSEVVCGKTVIFNFFKSLTST
jgi:ribosomal protein L10